LPAVTIGAADLVVIPSSPDPYDVWAAQRKSINLIKEASRILKKTTEAVFAINRKMSKY
jgi:cellulose biosynthesis protein BcsQ